MTPLFCSYVEGLWRAGMLADNPTVPIYFDNTDAPSDENTQYAVIHIMASEDTVPINVGIDAKSRNVGIIQVDSFAPVDDGPGAAQAIAVYSGKIFKRRIAPVANEGQVTFKDYSATSRGQIGGKFKYMMRIPYRYDFKENT